jgi:hypothetical protein
VAAIKALLSELDAVWTPLGGEPITLQVVGSAALMLQAAYERGTKDGDILESREPSEAVSRRLLELAGRGTDLHKRLRMHLDIVARGLMFLPPSPVFHPVAGLTLRHFSVEALDITEVVLSKLKRFHRDDADDIRAMAARGLVDHPRLILRFKAAVERYALDARAEDLPRYLKNLHAVERDFLGLSPTAVELPDD